MKQFTALLKSINERLDLPQPTKSRIILEIAADLDDLYQLYLKKDHQVKKLRAGLPLIIGLGGLNFMVGIMGYLIELYRAEDHAMFLVYHLAYIITTHEADAARTMNDITTWMIKSSSLIMFTIVSTIIIAVVCYIIMNKVLKIERTETIVLLGN